MCFKRASFGIGYELDCPSSCERIMSSRIKSTFCLNVDRSIGRNTWSDNNCKCVNCIKTLWASSPGGINSLTSIGCIKSNLDNKHSLTYTGKVSHMRRPYRFTRDDYQTYNRVIWHWGAQGYGKCVWNKRSLIGGICKSLCSSMCKSLCSSKYRDTYELVGNFSNGSCVDGVLRYVDGTTYNGKFTSRGLWCLESYEYGFCTITWRNGDVFKGCLTALRLYKDENEPVECSGRFIPRNYSQIFCFNIISVLQDIVWSYLEETKVLLQFAYRDRIGDPPSILSVVY